MKSLIAAAFVAGALVAAGPAAVNPAAAAPLAKTQTAGTSDATDFSAQRYHRRYHRHYGRPYYRPYYYGRPTLLSPVSLLFAGAVHLRHRVWTVLVVRRHSVFERKPAPHLMRGGCRFA